MRRAGERLGAVQEPVDRALAPAAPGGGRVTGAAVSGPPAGASQPAVPPAPASSAGLSGTIDGRDLATLLGFLAGLRKSGRLSISAGAWGGLVLLEDGRVVEAVYGAERGVAALEAIGLLAARSPSPVSFALDEEVAERGGELSLQLLQLRPRLEALAREGAALAATIPSLTVVPRVAAAGLGGDGPIAIDSTALRLLPALDGQRSVAELADRRGLAQTLRDVARLAELGLVALDAPVEAAPRPRRARRLPIPRPAPVVVRVAGWAASCGVLGATIYFAPGAAAVALAMLAVGVPLLWLAWARAELGLLALLGLAAELLRVSDLYVALPLGGLYPQDIALLGLLGLVMLKRLLGEGLVVPWWPVSKPLLIFLAVCVASSVYAVAVQHVEARTTLNELRPVAYFGVSVLTALVVTRRRQLVTLLVGLFALADVITGALIVQQFAGTGSFVLPGMETWQVNQVGAAGAMESQAGSPADGAFGLVRIVPPAHLLMFVMMVLAFILMFTPQRRRWLVVAAGLEFGYLNAGLLLTYTRAQWIASVIALGLAGLLLPRVGRARLARSLLVVVPLLAVGVGLAEAGVELPGGSSPFVSALVGRAISTLNPAETLESDSLQWRAFETEQAFRSLSQHPEGVGLGNVYRPLTTLAGEAAGEQGPDALNRFVHNSYLYIAVKTGLLGLAAFLWFCLAFLANSWRVFRGLADGPHRWLTLAILASFAGILQWSLTEANFMEVGSTAVVGLMVGLVASARCLAAVQDRRALGAA